MVDPQNITIPLSILAGLLSFISPCVLPMVPAYIGYLTTQAATTTASAIAATASSNEQEPTTQPSRWVVFLHGVFFVFGFSLIFVVIFGTSAGILGQISAGFVLLKKIITHVGGILIVILGMHMMGIIRIPFLYYDTRRQRPPKQELGFLGSLLMGITFAAGWSPCAGPILGAIMGLSVATGSIGRSLVLFAAYAAGLGIPFLLTALLIDQVSGLFRRLQCYMRWVELISGLLLMVIGVLVFFNMFEGGGAFGTPQYDLMESIYSWLVALSNGSQ